MFSMSNNTRVIVDKSHFQNTNIGFVIVISYVFEYFLTDCVKVD